MEPEARSTLAAMFQPRPLAKSGFGFLGVALAGTLVLTLAAKTSVPFYPVPMTLQSLAVLCIGAAFGFRLSVATLLLYLGEGLVGLPVFAGASAGPHYMIGATGGYLMGFLAAAAAIGLLVERGWARPWPLLLGAMLIGQALIYGLGLAWLASFTGLEKAIAVGFAPFALADLVKTLLACALVSGAGRMISRLRQTV